MTTAEYRNLHRFLLREVAELEAALAVLRPIEDKLATIREILPVVERLSRDVNVGVESSPLPVPEPTPDVSGVAPDPGRSARLVAFLVILDKVQEVVLASGRPMRLSEIVRALDADGSDEKLSYKQNYHIVRAAMHADTGRFRVFRSRYRMADDPEDNPL